MIKEQENLNEVRLGRIRYRAVIEMRLKRVCVYLPVLQHKVRLSKQALQ